MSTATRAQQKAAGWRKAMGDVKAKANLLAETLDRRSPMERIALDGVDAVDVVRRLLHLLDSAAGNARAEERAAFDSYFAALVSESSSDDDVRSAARVADVMLEERRKRFGGGKDE